MENPMGSGTWTSWSASSSGAPIATAAAFPHDNESLLRLPHQLSAGCNFPGHHSRRDPKRKVVRAAKRTSPLEEKWEQMEPVLLDLYKQCPLRLVVEIMQYLYHFQPSVANYKTRFKKRGIVKNTGLEESGRKRVRGVPIKKATAVPGKIIDLENFSFHPGLGDNLPLVRYRTQEQVLFEVDKFVGVMFDSRSKGWTANTFAFIDSTGCTSHQTDMWQMLSDICYGASILTKQSSHGKAETSLDQFFEELSRVAKSSDPSIMVKFWRICLQLRSIDSFNPRLQVVKRFFTRLQSIFASAYGQKHSLHLLMGLLLEVSPADFKDTLRIGYFKTITALSAMIGEENAIVLHMWSIYFKYWDKQYLQKEMFMKKFQKLWDDISDCNGLQSRNFTALCYYYIYAGYYLCEIPLLAEKMADNLLRNMEPLDESPNWTLTTQAFAFASQVLAECHRNRREFTHCHISMDFAIEKLQNGDRECRIRAAMLSRTLARWLGEWKNCQDEQKERLRTVSIQYRISGANCGRCRPKILCQKCASRRGILPKQRKFQGAEICHFQLPKPPQPVLPTPC